MIAINDGQEYFLQITINISIITEGNMTYLILYTATVEQFKIEVA